MAICITLTNYLTNMRNTLTDSFPYFSAGLSPGSSHDTSLTSRASSAEGAPAHITPFSTKRLDREFERKLQEVFVSVQLEKVCTKLTSDRKDIEQSAKQSGKQVQTRSNFSVGDRSQTEDFDALEVSRQMIVPLFTLLSSACVIFCNMRRL